MSYYYNFSGSLYSHGNAGLFCLVHSDDGDEDPLTPPPAQELIQRGERNCGSGSYYKLHLDPYLESETYTFLGHTCLGGSHSTSYWAGSDLLRGYVHTKSGSLHWETGWRQNQNYPNSGSSGFFYGCQLVHRNNESARWYSIRVEWSCDRRTNYKWGPWGSKGLSEDECIAATRSALEYLGVPDLLDNPVAYGNIDKSMAGPVSGTSLRIWKYGDNIIRSRTDSKPHLSWKYDQPSGNTLYEWFQCKEGFIPGRIRNAASLALANTMAGLPEVSANSVANVMELASGLSAFKGTIRSAADRILRMAKDITDPRNAWLSWRYVYNTTKMDLEDYRSVTNRLINMAGSPTFKVHGFGQGDGFVVRCVKQFATADFNVLDYDTRRLLKTYGFQLSAYNAWDMVPFSFMVDWFVNIGPKIELAENWNKQYEFTPEDTWYSYRENLSHGFIYFRWHNVDPHIPPTYVPTTTSKRTFTFRLADTVSIFT